MTTWSRNPSEPGVSRLHAHRCRQSARCQTILKIAGALGPDVMAQLHRQVIDVAKRAGVTRRRRFRVDTTVIETPVHYPTGSTSLQDGVRGADPHDAAGEYGVGQPAESRAESTAQRDPPRPDHRLLGAVAADRDALIESYRKLTATTRARPAGRLYDGPADRTTPARRRGRRQSGRQASFSRRDPHGEES
jgi:hypothetical protein